MSSPNPIQPARRSAPVVALLLTMILPAGTCVAGPWLAPGDATLRHDIQMLGDAGVISAPLATWPASWPDILAALDAVQPDDAWHDALVDALRRVREAARHAASSGFGPRSVRGSAAHKPTSLRSFSDTPREEAEVAAGAAWLGDRVAVELRLTGVSNPVDGQSARLDGSYASVLIGNLTFGVSAVDRWWGPGWDGSLILSSNARPIPAVSISRIRSDPFRTPILRWIGPWRAVAFMGQAERHDVAVPNVRVLGARISARPASWLEIGLSRTAQWCGDGRPCDLSTFADLVIGHDNVGDQDVTLENQAGNQMAGYDVRLRSPWVRVPIAVYAQAIGEDEAGGLPSKFMGLAGFEAWGSTRYGSIRVHAEYADTACNFSRTEPEFDCAYRHALYPQGYAYRGRAIGHALDNDGRMLSTGFLFVRPSGTSLSFEARRVDLNRAGAVSDLAHTVAEASAELDNLEVQYNHALPWGKLRLGAGFDSDRGAGTDSSETRGFIEWRQEF